MQSCAGEHMLEHISYSPCTYFIIVSENSYKVVLESIHFETYVSLSMLLVGNSRREFMQSCVGEYILEHISHSPCTYFIIVSENLYKVVLESIHFGTYLSLSMHLFGNSVRELMDSCGGENILVHSSFVLFKSIPTVFIDSRL